jgi:hypothetical protein
VGLFASYCGYTTKVKKEKILPPMAIKKSLQNHFDFPNFEVWNFSFWQNYPKP